MDNDSYEDTLPRRVVVTPTLIIPAYQVKKRRRKKEWRQRIALIAIIVTWLILFAFSAFLTWLAIGYAHGGFN